MSQSQVEVIRLLGDALAWLERELAWDAKPDALRHHVDRVGSLYAAFLTRGQLATDPTQKGFGVLGPSGEKIAVITVLDADEVTFQRIVVSRSDRAMVVRVGVEGHRTSVELVYLGQPDDLLARSDKTGAGYRYVLESRPSVDAPDRLLVRQRVKWAAADIVEYRDGAVRIEHAGSLAGSDEHLRMIATEVDVPIRSASGELRSTREIGPEVIAAVQSGRFRSRFDGPIGVDGDGNVLVYDSVDDIPDVGPTVTRADGTTFVAPLGGTLGAMRREAAAAKAANALRIAELPAGTLGGLIGVTFAPGKKQSGGMSGNHDRDLGADLDTIAAWNAAAVLTLTTDAELERLRIAELGSEVRARFMEWHHAPIEDYHVPDGAFEDAWPELSERLRSMVAAGNRVLVHCRGGLGRAGMVAARLLVEMGADPEDAIATVRRERAPEAIETEDQEEWVRDGQVQQLSPASRTPQAVRDRALGALLGLAVGDALGTTVEFQPKPKRAVLSDLVGGGHFELAPGQWTDDTAMALALGDSLIAHPDFDAADLMRRFVSWYREGAYSCTGRCFDIGTTIRAALERFERVGEPYSGSTDPNTAGNGSIMRLAPVAIRYWNDPGRRHQVAREQSRTTHGASEAVEACATLSDLIAAAIAGTSLPELVRSEPARRVQGFKPAEPRSEVRGTGYVVASLHAALWAVSRTSSYRDAVLLAANLGEDADTTAAVAGQIAGALYSASDIPAEWLARLAWRDRIEAIAAELFRASAS